MREARELLVQVRRLLGLARDDERRPRLVDEDVVDLIDDREGGLAADALLERLRHVVAQVVEAELGVRAVRDVGHVRRALRLVVLHVLQDAHAEAEEVVDRRHPLCVAPGEVVVDRDEVDAAAGQRVEDERERRREGLALAGAHLRDRPAVEDHPTDELHVEVTHPERPPAGLAHEREDLRQDLVEDALVILAIGLGEALPQRVDPGAQLLVGLELELGLERGDSRDPLLELLELLALADA